MTIVGIQEVCLDFRYFVAFRYVGGSKSSGVENWGQILHSPCKIRDEVEMSG